MCRGCKLKQSEIDTTRMELARERNKVAILKAEQAELLEHIQRMNDTINDQNKILRSISQSCDKYVEALDSMVDLAIDVSQSLSNGEIY